MKKTVLSLLLVCSLASVSAQTPKPDAESIKAATELAKTIGLLDQLAAGFDAMKPMIEGQIQQLQLNQAEADELMGIYKDWFTEDMDRAGMETAIIELYATEFTVEELKGLDEFYKSPLGQKTLVKLPQLMQKGAELGMREAGSKQELLKARLKPFFDKYEASRKAGAGAKPAN